MPTTVIGDYEICYESFGADDAPPLLLVMGFTAQMTTWPAGLISELLDRGFRVVRFDNRDSGLSGKTSGDPPDAPALLMAALAGQEVHPPYRLADMAADGIGLLDHLGIDRAHVVGASMGGMIAQTMAIEHPDRVRSLTSIMSTTGNPEVGQADPAAMAALLRPPAENRDDAIAQSVDTWRTISGPRFDEDRVREMARESYDRAFYPIGAAFQMAAIAAGPDRTAALAGVKVPTLVIHGRADPLITLSGGLATAEAVPGADLLVLGEMGHDLPDGYWPAIADAVASLAARADDGS
jgi:pimeloyl-ACP methyl ester carboxylesterase